MIDEIVDYVKFLRLQVKVNISSLYYYNQIVVCVRSENHVFEVIE